MRTFSPTQNSDLKDVTHIFREPLCDQQTCLYLKIKRKTDNSLCKMHEHASKCPLLEKYIKPDRGVPGKDGRAARWDHSVESDSEISLKIVKIALSLMFHVARRPQQNPKTQINKRFSALYATMFPNKQAPAIELDPTLDIKGTADWMSQEGLDQKILNILLFIPNDKLSGKTSQAFITQLKLFSTFSEMTPYVVMKALINDGIGHVMTLQSVADAAAKLVTVERELMEKHTKEKFPYLKILRLEGHERIVPQAFPNLFKVATLWKRKGDGTFREYRITKDLQSDVSDQDLEEAYQCHH